MRNLREVCIHRIRKTEPILRVVGRGVCSIHDSLASDCLLAFCLGIFDDAVLVIHKEDHISPLLDKRCGLLRKFQLPAIISSHLIRLFELTHSSVSDDDDVLA